MVKKENEEHVSIEPNRKRSRLQEYGAEDCIGILNGLGVIVASLEGSDISDLNNEPLFALGDAIEVYALQANDAYQKEWAEHRSEVEALRMENEALRAGGKLRTLVRGK